MDTSYLMAELRGLVDRVGSMLAEHFPARNERQDFIDRAAIALMAANPAGSSGHYAVMRAVELWEARQEQRGLRSERELVVRYLNRMARGKGNIGVPTDGLELLADAIKAGKHLEPDRDAQARGADAAGLHHLADALRQTRG